MKGEGIKERKAYYEKLIGWLFTGFLALIGGLSGLTLGKLEGFKLILFFGGLFLLPMMVAGILALHFSIMDLIKKLEEGDGN